MTPSELWKAEPKVSILFSFFQLMMIEKRHVHFNKVGNSILLKVKPRQLEFCLLELNAESK